MASQLPGNRDYKMETGLLDTKSGFYYRPEFWTPVGNLGRRCISLQQEKRKPRPSGEYRPIAKRIVFWVGHSSDHTHEKSVGEPRCAADSATL